MIKLLIFLLSFEALVHFSSSTTEQLNHVDIKSHNGIPAGNDGSKLEPAKIKNDHSGEFNLKQAHNETKAKPEISEQGKVKFHPKQNTHTVRNKTVDTEELSPSHNGTDMEQESNFLNTVSMVLISISLLFMVFVAFKTYRRKSRNARIKKYGVRLARGNIEMTPLPLDNDDDDDTIFDLKNLPT